MGLSNAKSCDGRESDNWITLLKCDDILTLFLTTRKHDDACTDISRTGTVESGSAAIHDSIGILSTSPRRGEYKHDDMYVFKSRRLIMSRPVGTRPRRELYI